MLTVTTATSTSTEQHQHIMIKTPSATQQFESSSSSNGTSKTTTSSSSVQSEDNASRSRSATPANDHHDQDALSPHFGPISASNSALFIQSPSLRSLNEGIIPSRTSTPAAKPCHVQGYDYPYELNVSSPAMAEQVHYHNHNGFQHNRPLSRKPSSSGSFEGNSLRASGSVPGYKIYSAIGSLEQYSYGSSKNLNIGYANGFMRAIDPLKEDSFSPPIHVLEGQAGNFSVAPINNLNNEFTHHPHFRSHFLPDETTRDGVVDPKNVIHRSATSTLNYCNDSFNQDTVRIANRESSEDKQLSITTAFDSLVSKQENNLDSLREKGKSGNLEKQLNMSDESLKVKEKFIKSSSMSQFNENNIADVINQDFTLKPKQKKKVKVKKAPTETFRPSCDAYTPRVKAKKIDYKPAQERASNAMSTTMGTISRPNFRDALRRVAMIIQQHIVKIEQRYEEKPFTSTRNCLFNKKMMDMFSEDNFVSPKFKYTMVRLPMARPGVICSVRNIKPTYEIPMEDEIYEFAHQLFKVVQLSSECSIVCLIYVERLMEVAKVPLMARTWKPIVMCGLLLASKVWQDLSSWNIEFASVYPQFSLDKINKLELLFLRQVKWDLYISSSLYAKYYFALRSLLEKKDFRVRYNRMVGASGRIDMSQAMEIQKRTERVKEESLNQLSQSM